MVDVHDIGVYAPVELSGTTEADICGFFNGALLAVNAQTGFTDLSLASDKPQLLPVERCEGLQENGRFCFLDLRSHEWVVLCLKLDGTPASV